MKLEDQVAPVALAQHMKELGFPQQTQFLWARFVAHEVVLAHLEHIEVWPHEAMDRAPGAPDRTILFSSRHARWWEKHVERLEGHNPLLCAAPTGAEMGRWLRIRFTTRAMGDRGWTASYLRAPDTEPYVTDGSTEAVARAGLLVVLAERGLIKPKDLFP